MIEFIADIVTRLRAQFAPDALAGSLAHGASNVVVAFGVFFAFYVLWILVGRALRVALERTHTDQTTASFSLTATKFVVLTLGAVEALSAVGINTAALLTSLGVAGLTIGFAARDALSNLISGVLIFWDRPFVIGDLVEVSGSYGRVDRITLRSTRVVTVDGRMLAVPNSTIINSVVASYTNFPHLRIDVAVTVGTGERIEHVRGVLLALVREDPAYLPDPSPRVVVKSLNDYNVEVELQAWLADEKAHIAARFALRERVLDALTEAGVDMPFETLTIRSPEPRAA